MVMFGSQCSPCCQKGCTLEDRLEIFNALTSASCSVTLAGVAPKQEIASRYLHQSGNVLCEIDQWLSGDQHESGATRTRVENRFDEEQAVLEVYEESDEAISTFDLALDASSTIAPGVNQTGLVYFKHVGNTLTITFTAAISDSRWSQVTWPRLSSTGCAVLFSLQAHDLPLVRTINSPQQYVSFGYIGPFEDSADDFLFQEMSFGWVQSEIEDGFYTTDLAPSDGTPRSVWPGVDPLYGFTPVNGFRYQLSESGSNSLSLNFTKETNSSFRYRWRAGDGTKGNVFYELKEDAFPSCNNVKSVGTAAPSVYRSTSETFEITPSVNLVIQ